MRCQKFQPSELGASTTQRRIQVILPLWGLSMRNAYYILGRWIFRHRNGVFAVWGMLLLLASFWALRAPEFLDAGSRPLEGTASAEVERILARDFAHPFAQSMAVTFRSKTAHYDDPQFQEAAATILARLQQCPGVLRAVLPGARFGHRFRSADGHAIALLVGLNASSVSDSEKFVPVVRECIRTALLPHGLPGWEWHSTGQAALIYDLNNYNAADSQRAEMRALPLTLLVLLLVFGSLVSTALPLILGVASTVLALGLVPLMAYFGPINILYQNVVTLLGLALGIDYSLFIVSRYREHRETLQLNREESLAQTLATTGVTVTYSGLSVLIGLIGLLCTPLFELRSIGLGGMAVVIMSLLLSLTLLPALLALLDPWLNAPKKLTARIRLTGSHRRWEKWTSLVLRHPQGALVLGLVSLLVVSSPLLAIRPGYSDKPWLPAAMETSQGIAALRELGQNQALTPINLVVRSENATPVLPGQIDAFFALSELIKQDPRVDRVFGPVDLNDDLQEFQIRTLYLNFEQSLEEHPELREGLLSRSRDQALVQVILKDSTGYDESLACARDLGKLRVPGVKILVGGQWVYSSDFNRVMLGAFPFVIGFVVVVIFLILLIAFRSFLVPIKAILLNGLSVAAAFGATVAVFQWGWGIQLLGLTEPTGAIPPEIPLIVFCTTFGLSMDYEVLILARVREEYLRDRNPDDSVRRGLIATGGLISGAAAIMVVVFGTFALADVVLVKMLGFGLAVAVLVDAIVVRAMLVPAAMKLAGRWNWYPGLR